MAKWELVPLVGGTLSVRRDGVEIGLVQVATKVVEKFYDTTDTVRCPECEHEFEHEFEHTVAVDVAEAAPDWADALARVLNVGDGGDGPLR